jgi:Fe-S oxidoreductase
MVNVKVRYRGEGKDILEASPRYSEWVKEFSGGSGHVKARVERDEKTLSTIEMGKLMRINPNATERERKLYFVRRIGELARSSRAFRNYMESCTHCGFCIDKCQMWLATRDPNNSPVGRADLVRNIYRRMRRFTYGLIDKLSDEKELESIIDSVDLDKIWTYYYQCTECRRCAYFCPFGIDQAEVTRFIRQIFVEMGMMPPFIAKTMECVYKTGNNMCITRDAALNVIDFVVNEISEQTGKRMEGVVDKDKADVLYIPSSTDFFTNIGTLKGAIAIMTELGLNWTMDSQSLEVGNFGLFEDEYHLRRFGDNIVNAALRRKVKVVVFGECGHGWRAFKNYVVPRLAEHGIEGVSITQLTAWAIRKGKLRFSKKVDAVVTYHDPCNLARAGDLVEEPRLILKSTVKEFREREHNRERTLCCGAGGGLLLDELMPLRVWAGWPSVYDAYRTGAQYMVAPCSIDKAQFPVVIEYHKVPLKFRGVSDFVYAALYGVDIDAV